MNLTGNVTLGSVILLLFVVTILQGLQLRLFVQGHNLYSYWDAIVDLY